MKKYNSDLVEKKWQEIWDKENIFVSKIDNNKPKYYVLEMFPYPSGDIHMGHVRNYTLGDLVARYKRSQGFNVLHPMGWDAFGLPAENAAIENKTHPNLWTKTNISKMKTQLKRMGLSYDWNRELSTCDPDYYKHEQKMFLDFYHNDLAYRKETWVNWDPVEQTVLANEQVIDGKGWRSGANVEKRKMHGWFLKITNFAEDLLNEIEHLKNWPEKVKTMQKNWIGKSIGATIKFNVCESKDSISVFSTRPDTLFGATFIAISPQHPFALKIIQDNKDLKNQINTIDFKANSEEEIEKLDKIGIKTSFNAFHPFVKDKKIPIFIANFILIDYGTGAIFGCPAHDQRDLDFAKKYNLEVIQVVSKSNDNKQTISDKAYTEDGILINSSFLNNLSVKEAINLSISKLEEIGFGKKTINYRLRDWGVSRQRYWGCPIPIIYCNKCGDVPVPQKDLPVELPQDITFKNNGNPLSNHKTWKNVKCPKCGLDAQRETDTFDTFFESSWYFARFTDPKIGTPFSSKASKYWLPVDQYIGGVEHAVLHLLYSRFFIKALNKLNQINIDEPFTSLQTQGMVCHRTFQNDKQEWLFPKDIYKKNDYFYEVNSNNPVKSGRIEKMSKSKKNVIDPNIIINNYGADTARFFILSDSPPDRDMEWTESGVEGSWRFLNKLWNMIVKDNFKHVKYEFIEPSNTKENKLTKNTFKCIQDVTKSIEDFHFNNAIASIRTLFNEINSFEIETTRCISIKKYSITQLIILLNPICPHFCEEAWQIIGFKSFLANEIWPKVQTKYLQDEKIVIPIQVNGKRRAEIVVNRKISENEIRDIAISNEKIKKFLSSKPKKIIVIPNRIINIVI